MKHLIVVNPNAGTYSEEFENSIIKLKNKKESDEYINNYIRLSQNYINYFSG